MATQNHVGVDDRRQLSVQDLIQHWDPSQRRTEPNRTFFQKCQQKIGDFNQRCDDFFTNLPTWVKVAFFVIAIGIIVASVGKIFADCHGFWRYRMSDHNEIETHICRPIIDIIDWCNTQSYCKPLVHVLEWLR